MSKYDDLFEATAPDDSPFADKAALDPLADPPTIHARDDQERELATILNGVQEGYLPPTVSIYGPPGTGKTLTTRRVCREFAARHDRVAVEYVNLKECQTLFSAANEILAAVGGEKQGAYAGLDGVFEAIWDALEAYPEWTVLVLDEIDHVQYDANYDPSDFFYRLLRGEGRLQRGLALSVWLVSNELLEVDLRLDSRVESAMSDEAICFPPYDERELRAILEPRLERAFREGAVPDDVLADGVREAARRWGDARKALTLFRQAGERAADDGRQRLTTECLEATLETTERAAVIDRLCNLPANHFVVLAGITAWNDATGLKQPVSTGEIYDYLHQDGYPEELQLGTRTIQTLVTDLETMGLVETWIDSRGDSGRVKQIETTFEPRWVREAIDPYAADSTYLDTVFER
ncbi:orc1/cdc6 family replication initiation protein [Natronococcus amylolyticus DSM 10524]|uniref:ORC1-type DNA replication protein n=1 Tax=Natronococcus amylolyticus DSM 10524 TaxID=1227497 RepID=L9WZW2_9EURY|nr:AAA family ATPase [Natronococcus amylolyticus]ELY54990.1 orc1/cdc6 family replication initiation protein [Natronococcus amylolyticus DSM 10524]